MYGDGSEVHDTEDMLESHVFSRGEHPPGGLELVDLSQALDPWVIDEFLFGRFRGWQTTAGDERDVTVDGVVRQAFAVEVPGHRFRLGFAIESSVWQPPAGGLRGLMTGGMIAAGWNCLYFAAERKWLVEEISLKNPRFTMLPPIARQISA